MTHRKPIHTSRLPLHEQYDLKAEQDALDMAAELERSEMISRELEVDSAKDLLLMFFYMILACLGAVALVVVLTPTY